MRSRIITLFAAFLLVIGTGSFLMASPAYAQYQEWCFDGSCLNAWNGGPYVNVYSSGLNIDNDYFQEVPTASGNSQYFGLQYVGGTDSNSPYQDDCIGDYNDSSSDARAGLFSNCTEATGVAWGANFTVSYSECPDGSFAFKNVHWGGYLAPAGFADGDAFYLNNPTIYCYLVT